MKDSAIQLILQAGYIDMDDFSEELLDFFTKDEP
jgi:hypothetical protein